MLGSSGLQELGCHSPVKHFPKYGEFCTHLGAFITFLSPNLTSGKGMLVVQKFQNRNNEVSERKESIATL